VAIASPTGRDVKSNIPIADTPTILRATHIPVPKKISKVCCTKGFYCSRWYQPHGC